MKLLVNLVLTCSLSLSIAVDTGSSVNWTSDNESLPELLPKKMRDKSNEEIQKAVFNAYENQMKIISEHGGHFYDSEPPYEYFKNEYPIPDAPTFHPEYDLLFYKNVVRGLREYKKNNIVIKWAPDQVETEVEWTNAVIRGNYMYSNSTYMEQGKYHIKLGNLKYLANTSLTENTMSYPSMIPKSSISYKSVQASFSGHIPEITYVQDSTNFKHFLEDITFQHIADRIAKAMHNNITVAVRQAIKPYIIFKNVSDPLLKDFTGSLSSGVQFKVSDISTNGLNQTHLRLKNVLVDMGNKNVTAVIEFVLHKLNGNFLLNIDESKPYSGQAKYNIDRINVFASSNMLKGEECTANTTVHNTRVETNPDLSMASEVNEIVAKEFSNNIVNRFNSVICSVLANMLNTEAGNY